MFRKSFYIIKLSALFTGKRLNGIKNYPRLHFYKKL